MTEQAPATAGLNDCWNRIGVAGDGSCPQLAEHIHCRNCPVFAAGGETLFDRQPPDGYLDQWRAALAAPPPARGDQTLSVVIFRLGEEWLAMDTAVFKEATDPRPVHRIPHRTAGALGGVVSIRGELHLCVHLARLLGITHQPEPHHPHSPGVRRVFSRHVVIHRGADTWVFPVDELFGVHRVERGALKAPPTTVAKSADALADAIFDWQGHAVGYLDAAAVFATIRKQVL